MSLAALSDLDIDWVKTMRRVNAEFVGPALWAALTALGFKDRLPGDVRDYLTLLHTENARCNREIRAQCEAIGVALAAADTGAVLLKGAAFLFEDGLAKQDRMLRDVDLLIDARRQDSVRIALRGIGYREATKPCRRCQPDGCERVNSPRHSEVARSSVSLAEARWVLQARSMRAELR